jgi:glycolate oxidase FAD binding subunit
MSAPFAALPAARHCDPARFAIGGALPRVALRPQSAEEAAAAVAACSRDGLALAPWGGGVALSLESSPPPRYDVALDLGGLNRITTYDPDDFTVTAECGITLAELRATLAAHGQELPLEAAAGATLGGVLAANASGARRRALGSPRDRILGARFVTGDGGLVRTGGRVVKNVAGHAVHRLLVGSRGGLGVFVEASLKLPPHPPARALVVHGADAALVSDAARWSGLARLEPAVLTVLGRTAAASHPAFATGAPFTVVTGFEGDPAWVEACTARILERLGAPVSVRRDDEVPPLWAGLADAGERPGPRLAFACADGTPAAIASILLHPAAAHLVFHAPAGRLVLWPEAADLEALAQGLESAGFSLIEQRGAALDTPRIPAAVLGLRARIAQALDPAGTLAYGARWRAGR